LGGILLGTFYCSTFSFHFLLKNKNINLGLFFFKFLSINLMLYYVHIPKSNTLCCLEVVKKFVVVVCKPILVFSFSFYKAEQK
jgi:hypothetical protein